MQKSVIQYVHVLIHEKYIRIHIVHLINILNTLHTYIDKFFFFKKKNLMEGIFCHFESLKVDIITPMVDSGTLQRLKN